VGPRRKLIVGVDQGLFAAAVGCQRNLGQLRTLAEVVNTVRGEKRQKSLIKVGPTAFGKRVKQVAADRSPGSARR
jgi:hypothetical protein